MSNRLSALIKHKYRPCSIPCNQTPEVLLHRNWFLTLLTAHTEAGFLRRVKCQYGRKPEVKFLKGASQTHFLKSR